MKPAPPVTSAVVTAEPGQRRATPASPSPSQVTASSGMPGDDPDARSSVPAATRIQPAGDERRRTSSPQARAHASKSPVPNVATPSAKPTTPGVGEQLDPVVLHAPRVLRRRVGLRGLVREPALRRREVGLEVGVRALEARSRAAGGPATSAQPIQSSIVRCEPRLDVRVGRRRRRLGDAEEARGSSSRPSRAGRARRPRRRRGPRRSRAARRQVERAEARGTTSDRDGRGEERTRGRAKTDASSITPSAAAGDRGDRQPPPRAERDGGQPDRERGAGERAEVLVAEERHLALPGPAARPRVVDDPEEHQTPHDGGRDAPRRRRRRGSGRRRPCRRKSSTTEGASSAYSIDFAAVIRCFVGMFDRPPEARDDEERRAAPPASEPEPARPRAERLPAEPEARRRPQHPTVTATARSEL